MKMSLAGLAAVLAMAASAAPTAAPAQAAASENWMMRVSYEGEPYWISVRDMESRKPGATIHQMHTLSILLPQKNGSGQTGWVLSHEEYDCDHGAMRTLESNWRAVDGTAVEPRYKPSAEFTAIIPHTPPVVILAAICDAGIPRNATTFSGTPAEVYAHQAQMRKDALGY